jgi:hypothetical protein
MPGGLVNRAMGIPGIQDCVTEALRHRKMRAGAPWLMSADMERTPSPLVGISPDTERTCSDFDSRSRRVEMRRRYHEVDRKEGKLLHFAIAPCCNCQERYAMLQSAKQLWLAG